MRSVILPVVVVVSVLSVGCGRPGEPIRKAETGQAVAGGGEVGVPVNGTALRAASPPEAGTAETAVDRKPNPEDGLHKQAAGGAPRPAGERKEGGDTNGYEGQVSAERLTLARKYSALFESPVEGGPRAQIEGMKAALRLLEAMERASRYKLTLTPAAEARLMKATSSLQDVNGRVIAHLQGDGNLKDRLAIICAAYESAAEGGHAIPVEARTLLAEFGGRKKQEPFFATGTFGYSSARFADALRAVRTAILRGELSAGEFFNVMESVAAAGAVVRMAREGDRRFLRLVELLPETSRAQAIEAIFWEGSDAARAYDEARRQLSMVRPKLPNAGETQGQEEVIIRAQFPEFKLKLESEYLELERKKRETLSEAPSAPDRHAFALLHDLNDALRDPNLVLGAAVPEFEYRFKPVLPDGTSRDPKDQVLGPLTLPGKPEDMVPEILLGKNEFGFQTSITIRARSRRTLDDKALGTWEGCIKAIAGAVRQPEEEFGGVHSVKPVLDDAKRADAEAAFAKAFALPRPSDPKTLKEAHSALFAYLLAKLDLFQLGTPLCIQVLSRDARGPGGERPDGLVRDVAFEFACWVLRNDQGQFDALAEYTMGPMGTARAVLPYAEGVLKTAEKAKRKLTGDEARRLARALAFVTHAARAERQTVEGIKGLFGTAQRAASVIPDTDDGRELRGSFNRALDHWTKGQGAKFRQVLEGVSPLPTR